MKKTELNDPILIAAWPGMGRLAVTACYYLIAKLSMDFRAEYATNDLFDVDHVVIDSGLVQPFRYPKNQFFVWKNPKGGSDLLVFIGEAQPPHGRYDFCRKLIDYAQREGVSKVFTFAAMATGIGLDDNARVIGVATDKDTLHKLIEHDVTLLRDGSISGMNGVLLGVAAERKLPGGCLLGEMPNTFVNVPYPKGALAVLKAFSQIIGFDLDLSELQIEADRMGRHLSDAMAQMRRLEQQRHEPVNPEEDETFIPDPMDDERLSQEEKERLERMFGEAENDRAKAYELKRELDNLGVFKEYEDRFLDLFNQDE